jgi:ketosteroid isomerase-like protein
MANENADLIRAGFALFEEQGLEGLVELIDPEIEVFASSKVLNNGTYHGRDGFIAWSQRWFDAWQDIKFEALEFIEITPYVFVVPAKQKVVGAGSGIEIEQEIFWLIELSEDSQISRFHLYAEREDALTAGARLSRGEDPIPVE